ncbi:hypothetical protein POM88_013732 [Heracleum sosnowskyi]|uniref:TF-B3 domain-containing protein n=1 Tax=Heracleum sosnowskyi TaxID=360622 RepID=A0AAD8J1N1_9APIA|nr:hypothetical protein POM88_013732 [Heracleum sosnowskyi]
MSSIGSANLKFVKFLSRVECKQNSLILPFDFVEKYGRWIPKNLIINIGNAYEIAVQYHRGVRTLFGVSKVFEVFELKGGETLFFNFFSDSKLSLFIVGTKAVELNYALILDPLSNPSPRLGCFGRKFVIFLTCIEAVVDEIDPPLSFFEELGFGSADDLRFSLNNGRNFQGSYMENGPKITGFERMCRMLGVHDLNCFHLMLFTYNGNHSFDVAVFDESLVEIIFPGDASSNGNDLSFVDMRLLMFYCNIDNFEIAKIYEVVGESSTPVGDVLKFEVVVQKFHMYDYCHGVDIGQKFKNVFKSWGKNVAITVYQGNRSWIIQIRKRRDLKRTSMHEGWQKFRDDLKLKVGDICVFTYIDDSTCEFEVEVCRK